MSYNNNNFYTNQPYVYFDQNVPEAYQTSAMTSNNWEFGDSFSSPASKLSYLSNCEDNLSDSSLSLSNTPEIGQNQVMNGSDMLYNTPTHEIDPVVYTATPQKEQDNIPMMIPLLQSFSTLGEMPYSMDFLSIPDALSLHRTHAPQYNQASINPLYNGSHCTTNLLSSEYGNNCTQQHVPFPIQEFYGLTANHPDYTQHSNIHEHCQSLKTSRRQGSKQSYPCTFPDCAKTFTRPYNLKSHMRTHTQERPYECQFKPCGWKFARPHDLKRHELQHTGEKPHTCRFCLKKFARSDALKRHWKVDVSCAEAFKEETRLNGGKEVHYPRRKRSKNNISHHQ